MRTARFIIFALGCVNLGFFIGNAYETFQLTTPHPVFSGVVALINLAVTVICFMASREIWK